MKSNVVELKCLQVCMLAALAGCAAGPDYQRPPLAKVDRFTEAPAPESFSAGEAAPLQHLKADADLPAQWWEMFKSPALDELVRASLANNPSIAAAQAALVAAEHNVKAQQAAYYPNANLSYAASRQRIPESLASPASSGASYYNLHTLQLELNYTPDVFGANRRQVESLQAQADNQRWQLEAAYLALTSNVVAAVIEEAALREQIRLAARQVEVQQLIVASYRRQLELGQVAQTDLILQEAQMAGLQAALPPLEKQLALQRDLIKALAGRLPSDALAAEFSLSQLHLPEDVPLTVPSTLVDRRPDVLAAEAQLQSASASIGVAVAARLPSVQLGVNAWGSSAYTLGTLFSSGSGFWTLAAGVTQPVFDAGALKHRELAARAEYDGAVAQYRSTVIAAYQNVADSLQSIAADAQALKIATDSQRAADRTLAITRRQLELGDTPQLAVLLAEQGALQAQINTQIATANRLSDTALLFQSLGGGWWNRKEPIVSTSSAGHP